MDTNSQHGFYHTPSGKNWSSIADEVQNFDQFACGTGTPTNTLTQAILADIWTQFDLILAAGVQPAQDTTTPAYASTWLPNAVTNSGLTMPVGFQRTAQQTLDSLVNQEGGVHSYARFDPLAVSSVEIGENTIGSGQSLHTFTDGGIGFTKVQPYNRGTRNIYKPDESFTRGAEILNANIAGYTGSTDANQKVWFGCYKYNAGNYGGGQTATQLRNAGAKGAVYADGIFTRLGLPLPP